MIAEQPNLDEGIYAFACWIADDTRTDNAATATP
jgi:hypothetical protein